MNNNHSQSPPAHTSVGKLGEFGLIQHLTKYTRHRQPSTIKGIGDDAAVVAHGSQQTVVSTDLLIEGIHFDLMYTPLKHLGYKAVVVNLSDIYAMNATPKQITVSIAISSRFTVEALDELYDGIHTACRNYNVDLIGGDTSASNKGMFISVTALGTAAAKDVVYRNTAQVDDLICVSGDLGAAYLGLQLLEREKQIFLADGLAQPDLDDQSYLVGRLLKPEARKDIPKLLKDSQIKPTAMIDVSDGLSSDLLHICRQSQVGCRIFDENIPLHNDTVQQAIKFKIPAVTCALNGGEDYELLFTVEPKHLDALEIIQQFGAIRVIGKITEPQEGTKLFTKTKAYDLKAQGWRHL